MYANGSVQHLCLLALANGSNGCECLFYMNKNRWVLVNSAPIIGRCYAKTTERYKERKKYLSEKR